VILRPLSNFTGNGVLRGTITALDDLGEPLGGSPTATGVTAPSWKGQPSS
jgi:hypothetical protein